MSMLDTLTQQEEEKPFIVTNRRRFDALGTSLVIVTPAMAYPMVPDNADVNIWLISHVWDLFFWSTRQIMSRIKDALDCQVMVLSLHWDLYKQSQCIGYTVQFPDVIGPK